MKNTLNAVLNAYGPSGREDKISAVIRELVAPYVDEIKTDAMGNLICLRKGQGKRVMLAAHMDQIAFAMRSPGFFWINTVAMAERMAAG